MAPKSPRKRGQPPPSPPSPPPPSPPRAGPSASSAAHATSTSRDELSEVQNAGAADADAPQFEWVYNSDHTDPVNFGYMFLKPVGTRPTRTSAASSQISVSLPSPSVAPQLSKEKSTPATDSPISNDAFAQTSRYSFISVDPIGASSASKDCAKQSSIAPQPPRSPSESSTQGFVQHQIPYRSSPHFGTSANPPPEQFTPPDSLQWKQPYRPSVSQRLRPPPTYHHQTHTLENMVQTSQGNVDPLTSASPPVLTPASFVNISPTSSKGKRKLSASPVMPPTLSPFSNSVSFQPLIRKRRLHINAHQPGSFETNLSLCTRCQQYLIPGSEPGMCISCLQESDLYIWPSVSSSRMENLESLVLYLLPSHMEKALIRSGADSLPRGQSWRPLAYKIPHSGSDLSTLLFQDQWTLSKQQARSVGLFGQDYEELADIAQTFERSVPVRNPCLEAACTTMIAVCDLYKCVIAPPNPRGFLLTTPIAEVLTHVRTVRITLRNAFQQLQYLAFSPSTMRTRQDWLPVFLSAAILATTAIVFLDLLSQFPSPYREQIWGAKWHNHVAGMRDGGYGMLLDVLRANTNGMNPLKLDCWGRGDQPKPTLKDEVVSPFIISTPKSYTKARNATKDKGKGVASTTSKRSGKDESSSYFWETPGQMQSMQDILLGNQSASALQGMIKLKEWQANYGEHLQLGDIMLSKKIFAVPTIHPIGGLTKIFNFDKWTA